MEMQLHKRHFKEHSNCERNFFWGSIQTWDGWVVSANPTSLVCRAPSHPQDLNMRPIFFVFQADSGSQNQFPASPGGTFCKPTSYRTPACNSGTSFSGTLVELRLEIRTLRSAKTAYTSMCTLLLRLSRFDDVKC